MPYTTNVLQPCFHDSRFLCPMHYSWMTSDYDAERYNNPISQMFFNGLTITLFSYDKVNIVYSSMLSIEFMILKMIKCSLPLVGLYAISCQTRLLLQHWILVIIMNKKKEFHILNLLWELYMYEPQVKKPTCDSF